MPRCAGYVFVPRRGLPVLAYAASHGGLPEAQGRQWHAPPEGRRPPGLYHATVSADGAEVHVGRRIRGGAAEEIQRLTAITRSRRGGKILTAGEVTLARTARALVEALREHAREAS